MADELDLQTQQTLRDSGADKQPNMQPSEDPDSITALDALLKEAEKKKEANDDTDNSPDAAGAAGAPDDKAAKAADSGAPKADAVQGGAGDGGNAAPGASAADSADPVQAGDQKQAAADPFEEIQLPPHTSPKAADSFNAIKAKAKAEIEARDRDLAEAKTKLKEFESKVSATPEEKAELESLRKLRASLEIENDPEFKTTFQTRIDQNNEVIYAKLTEAGMTTAQIDTIKKLGGPLKLGNWDDVYGHLSPSQKRVVDAKLTESENLVVERDQKLKAAKENVEKYLQERDTKSKVSVEAEAKVIESTANDFLAQLPWIAEKPVDPKATDEQKKALAEDNQFAKERVTALKGYLADRSPETHAMLAVGTAQAFHFKRELERATKEVERLSAANKELNEKITKIKKSGATRHSSGAPVSGDIKPKVDIFTTHGGDALDALAAEKRAAH